MNSATNLHLLKMKRAELGMFAGAEEEREEEGEKGEAPEERKAPQEGAQRGRRPDS